ncbi:unnamed protein product [Clonostachys solani]|uniref:Uncharacterized protein n=1 Tax=Clonostachys solani TaxID=160281 RepID=A0A9P0EMP3_9HYPO|nr:unnamed protein product [Clonostachys solani]
MSGVLKTAVSGSCAGHELIVDPDWVQEEQLIINKLSAKCQANIAALKSQLLEHTPEALQKLEDFFVEPLIVFDGIPYQWFNFTPSIHDQPNDLTTIKNILTGIIELTQEGPGISAIRIFNTKVLNKLDWLRDSLLRFLNRLAGHGGYIHHLPQPDSQFLPSKYESLRNHVEHWILLGKGSENIRSREFSTLQERLIDGILLRKDRFQRAQAHYKKVMGTSTLKGKGREQSRFKSPIQAEFTLDMHNVTECPDITVNDPYRTCPCCFQSIPERYVQSPYRWR